MYIIKKILSYRKDLIKYRWSFVIALALWLVSWALSHYNIYHAYTPYILSSIAQGLASLMALLFVIIFFLCQSTRRASILSKILKPDGFFLLGIYVLSIMISLLLLQTSPKNLLELKIASIIFLSGFCLLALFPFVEFINKKIKELGIHDIIADLAILNFPEQNFKYGEAIDELYKIGPQDICSLCSDIIVETLIKELFVVLNNNLSSNEVNIIASEKSIKLIISISEICGQQDCKNNIFKTIHEKIGVLIQKHIENTYRGVRDFWNWLTEEILRILTDYKWTKDCLIFLKDFYIKVFIRILGITYIQSNNRVQSYGTSHIRDKIKDAIKKLLKEKSISEKDIKTTLGKKDYTHISGSYQHYFNNENLDKINKYVKDLLEIE